MAREKKSEFDKMCEDFNSIHSKRLNALMVTAEEDEFAVLYFKLIEHIQPKLMRSEVITESEEQVIRIEHTYSEDKEDKDTKQDEK